jgi:hypothetical protein
VLLHEPRDLEGGEVLAVLADPVVGAAVEEEEPDAVADDDVPEVAGMVDAVAVLRGVRFGIVEVALEERRIGRDATDLADGVRVVPDLAVRSELGGRTLRARSGS